MGIWFTEACVLTSRLMVLLLFSLVTGTTGARHPLEAVDTSSPRATMKSFLTATEEVGRRYTEYRNSPSAATMAVSPTLFFRK